SNVIPSEVTLSGTLRTYKPDVQKQVHKALDDIFSIVERLGGTYQLDIRKEDPALNNNTQINQFIRSSFDALYPDYVQHDIPFGLGGEDFANVAEVVPSAMFFLGSNAVDMNYGMLHTSYFNIDERVMPVGVAVLSLTAVKYLKASGGVVNSECSAQ